MTKTINFIYHETLQMTMAFDTCMLTINILLECAIFDVNQCLGNVTAINLEMIDLCDTALCSDTAADIDDHSGSLN